MDQNLKYELYTFLVGCQISRTNIHKIRTITGMTGKIKFTVLGRPKNITSKYKRIIRMTDNEKTFAWIPENPNFIQRVK